MTISIPAGDLTGIQIDPTADPYLEERNRY
jgi:hypothetical protein